MTTPAIGVPPTDHDRFEVVRLLGREPNSDYTIVVRDRSGIPVVIRNAPIMNDGTPMPTLFWLIGANEVAAVGRLEATGAIDAVEEEIGLEEIADIHARYGAIRDAEIPQEHTGPRPFGGVGGTRTGVKCLHAHLAHWLAGGVDAVGQWTADRLKQQHADIAERVR